MINFAYVIMEGNLTADPELKRIGNGKQVCTFSIAVNHYNRTEEGDGGEVSFVEVEVWDKQAENCAEYLKKGRSVTVMGNLKQDRWKAQDGTGRNKLKIIAVNVRFNPSEKIHAKVEERKAA
ncbi:MAG: single-stranded DNA-binding protein [Leptospiraceae bacterium]|nr:single-stranded DNA-binding protein [Leptospiraceae bacterium]